MKYWGIILFFALVFCACDQEKNRVKKELIKEFHNHQAETPAGFPWENKELRIGLNKLQELENQTIFEATFVFTAINEYCLISLKLKDQVCALITPPCAGGDNTRQMRSDTLIEGKSLREWILVEGVEPTETKMITMEKSTEVRHFRTNVIVNYNKNHDFDSLTIEKPFWPIKDCF